MATDERYTNNLLERMVAFEERLNQEGRYTDANIVFLAMEEITKLFLNYSKHTGALRECIRINTLRWNPGCTHEEINVIINNVLERIG